MEAPDNVIDFTLARKRRHARLMAQVMWNLYASQARLTMFQPIAVVKSSETQRA